MRSVQDAIYNWLTIKVVVDERPGDTAAYQTEKLFYEILTDEFELSNIEIQKDEEMYYVLYQIQGDSGKKRFPRELIEVMLNQIKQEPEKYRNYSGEL
ncbi:hypothetical protein ACE38V_02925 [Cytobacillus sp. Hz8]|uniref:hypothetical protein n=1 Tax=Cytobacillus sp. Hz8 TaxID=3347168 RepID=UPI0035DDF973